MNAMTELLNIYNEALKKAISQQDKNAILHIYDMAKIMIRFDQVEESVADEYDKLVEQANEVLYG